MFLLLFFLLAVPLALIFLINAGSRKKPPGPMFSFPVVGHLPLLGTSPPKTFMKWKKQYGPIFSVQMGSYSAVVLNNYPLIRKAFNGSWTSGRPDSKFHNAISGNRRGFIFSDGVKALEQRKFAQKILKDFTYSSQSLESRILDQIPSFIEIFEGHLSDSLHVKGAFNRCIFNVLWTTVAGKNLDKNDDGFKRLASNVSQVAEMDSVIEKLMVFVKFIPDFFPEISGFGKKIRGIQQIQKYLQEHIEGHKNGRVEDQPRDMIDAYLDRTENTTDPQSSFFPSYGNITFSIQDMFMAGVDTTTTALEWILFYLVKYPDVQRRIQKEIDDVLDSYHLPSSEHREKLPYVEAVIQEVLRITSFAPLGLLHNAMEDNEFNGYIIPKDTMIIGNIFAVQHDEEVWGDPETFRPERFMDAGKLIKVEELIPFSIGKRSCIGEQLAMLQLFLCTVTIFQKYSMKAVGELPSEDGIYGFITSPNPFEIDISRRIHV